MISNSRRVYPVQQEDDQKYDLLKGLYHIQLAPSTAYDRHEFSRYMPGHLQYERQSIKFQQGGKFKIFSTLC